MKKPKQVMYQDYSYHKKPFLIIFFFIVAFGVYGQEDMNNIISPLGGTYEGDEVTLDYTLGIWTVLNMDNSNGQIGNGLFNEKYIIVNVADVEQTPFQLNIYPNPTVEWLNLKVQDLTIQPIGYTIVDPNGKLVLKGEWPRFEKEIRINLSNLNSKIYYLNISGRNQKILKSLKFVKIN